MLSLTVSASQPVAADGIPTRAINNDTVAYTKFEAGDSIGVIIMDAAGNLLADNVPYKFDGTNWAFHADNTEGKQPAYYDVTMKSYIVYFPYSPMADECKSVDDIKKKFAPHKNQHTKEEYLSADIMVWTSDEGPIKSIKAEMSHVYDTFSLVQPKIKCSLIAIGEDITYSAMDSTLTDFKIEFTPGGGEKIVIKDNTTDLTYHADDHSYRYLLPEGQEDKSIIEWQYTYRGITFHGKRVIQAKATGTRFTNSDTADMGELSGSKMRLSDFYCTTADEKGYVIPWDAEEHLEGRHCIGLVAYVGQHIVDLSDYSTSGIGETKCQGYVISLTDTFSDPFKEIVKITVNGKESEYGPLLQWWKLEKNGQPSTEMIGTVGIRGDDVSDWSGYFNYKRIFEYADDNGHNHDQFPVAYTCEIYGTHNIDGEVSEIPTGLKAPENSSDWFISTTHMLSYLNMLSEIKMGGIVYDTFEELFAARLEAIKHYAVDAEIKDPLYNPGNCNYLDFAKGLTYLENGASKYTKYWGTNEAYVQSSGGKIYCLTGKLTFSQYYKFVVSPKATTTSNSIDAQADLKVRVFLAF